MIAHVDTYQLSPRVRLERGSIIRVKGLRGRFVFLGVGQPEDKRRKSWIDCMQVDSKNQQMRGGIRSVYPDRIRRAR